MDGEVGDKCGLNTMPGIFSDKENDQPGELVISQGEGISFLMGCSKNYIMYWGGYVYYNSTGYEKSVHKLLKI